MGGQDFPRRLSLFLLVRLGEGRTAFNQGEFFLAHEIWEEVWHQITGPERTAVQGLIQVAAGCHHLRGGRRGPAAALLEKGAAKLSALISAKTASLLFESPPADLAGFGERAAQVASRLKNASDGGTELKL